MDFSFAGNDGLQRKENAVAGQARQQQQQQQEPGDSRGGPPAGPSAASRPGAIAVPSFRDVQQAEKRRAVLPSTFSLSGGRGPAAVQHAAANTGQPAIVLQQHQQQINPLSFVDGGVSAMGGSLSHPQQVPGQPRLGGHLQPYAAGGVHGTAPARLFSQHEQLPQQQSYQPPLNQQSMLQKQHQQQRQAYHPPSGATSYMQPPNQNRWQQQQPPDPQQHAQPAMQQPVHEQLQLPQNAIIVNRRQEGNPVLKFIRNVRWQYGDIVPDYVLGRDTACLFLSLRYHLLKPEYIHHRIKELQRSFRLRIIMCHVDTEDAVEPLAQVTRAAIGNECTLVCGWSNQECARYLETFKSYENKPAEVIQKDLGTDYLSRINAVLTTVRGVNKTDVKTMGDRFLSVGAIFKASADALQSCPGIGPTKARRLHDTFHQPFRRSVIAAAPQQARADSTAMGGRQQIAGGIEDTRPSSAANLWQADPAQTIGTPAEDDGLEGSEDDFM